jgi:hypothetical protein
MSEAPAASEPAAPPAPATPSAPGGQPSPAAPAVDVQRLAERVYRLLQAEVRLSTARGLPRPGRGGPGR